MSISGEFTFAYKTYILNSRSNSVQLLTRPLATSGAYYSSGIYFEKNLPMFLTAAFGFGIRLNTYRDPLFTVKNLSSAKGIIDLRIVLFFASFLHG